MSAVVAPAVLARLLADPINRYIGGTSIGILWVILLGKSFYFNPITDNQATPWGMISFNVSHPFNPSAACFSPHAFSHRLHIAKKNIAG